jgi:hypothetical protein
MVSIWIAIKTHHPIDMGIAPHQDFSRILCIILNLALML